MNKEAVDGLALLCLCAYVPFMTGALCAWKLRGRVMRYGLPWALLPKFLRERWQQ